MSENEKCPFIEASPNDCIHIELLRIRNIAMATTFCNTCMMGKIVRELRMLRASSTF